MKRATQSGGSVRELTGHFDGQGLTELCQVVVEDDPHPVNGACHRYSLWRKPPFTPDPAGPSYAVLCGTIQFQRGPRHEPDSTPGTLDGAVLSVLIDRYESFQRGPFACPENDTVLKHFLAAREGIIERAKERAGRDVLGKNEK